MMIQLWQTPFRLTQIQGLCLGLLIGYISFVLWLGMRWIVLSSGGLIVVLAIAFWYAQLQTQKASYSVSSANLLKTEIFLIHISILNDRVPEACQSLWRSVQAQAQAIQQTAAQIAQQESTFIPDLLETLHTVLDLVDQLVQALQVTQQVQMPHYQELSQIQLQSSLDRLQQTQDQLQELRDQMALASLEQRSRITPSGISTRLQMLITENEKGILGD
jgi:signal transduction histidine kinase